MEEKEEEKIIDKESPVELILTSDTQYTSQQYYFRATGRNIINELKKTQTEDNKIVKVENITKNTNNTYRIDLKLYDLGFSIIDLKSSDFKSVIPADKLIVYSEVSPDRILKDISSPIYDKDKSFYTFVVLEYENESVKLLELQYD